MPTRFPFRGPSSIVKFGAGAVLIAVVWLVAGKFREAPLELRVGYSSFAPYVIDGPDGKVSGLAVDIINEAARRAKIRLTYVPSGEDIDAALTSGKIDIFPLLTLTKERKQAFHTSEPWWENDTVLTSLESNPIDDAKGTAGKRVAIRGLPILKAIAARIFPHAQLSEIPRIGPMIAELCSGGVDAIFLDVRLLQSNLLKGPAPCVGKLLHVRPVAEGSLSLATVARKAVAPTADLVFEQIAELAIDGTLPAMATKYSVISSIQNRHMKDILAVQKHATEMRYGLSAALLILLITVVQTQRMRRARTIAEESRQRFDEFMKHTPAVTFIKNERGEVIYINREAERDLARELQQMDSLVLETNRSVEVTESVVGPTGVTRHFLCLKFPFSSRSGPRLAGTVALDITERKRAEEALRFSQFSIDRSPDLVLWVGGDGRIFYANEAAAQRLGYRPEELSRMKFEDVDCGFGSRAFARRKGELKNGGSMTVESLHRRSDGGTFPVELSLNYLEMDGRGSVCCMSRDITERKRAERELSHQAQHDLLTGLPNRRYFETRLAHCVEAARLTTTGLAVFYFDFDGFKLVNDTHGHTIGDALLKQAVHRLGQMLRECDVLARMGGDEFTLIANGIEGREGAQLVAEKLLSSLQEAFVVDGHELLITASLGISLLPDDGEDGITLLRHADAAMYEAKREGKNRIRFFRPEMNAMVRERLDLESYLRRALERGEFVVHYQPEISLATNKTIRNEALIRWNHPVLGLIPPGKFIPIAEDTGLIVPIGNWVLEEACRQTRKSLDAGSPAGVGVNVSSVQFSRPDYVSTVVDALRRTGLPPGLLELELTESVVMQSMDDVAGKILELRNLGVSVSIDDFGTGYSSLSYLQKLRIDNLKIDRSFVRDIPGDANALALTKAMVSLAHSLGMSVVIEGIESIEQLEAIRGIGCDIAQGFYLGRPEAPVLEAQFELAEIA